MKYIILLLFLLSCSPIFITDEKLNKIWINKSYNEIIDILGPFNRKLDDLSNGGYTILIWEASKNNILIPIEMLGGKKNKLGTSISSLPVYVDKSGNITNIKNSVY